jgi:hypothetical protein
MNELLAADPVLLLVCVLCILLAGITAGWIAGDAARRAQAPNDAGDTHASADWMASLPAASAHLDLRALPTRRVRAIGADLKPSFDSRKAAARPPIPANPEPIEQVRL